MIRLEKNADKEFRVVFVNDHNGKLVLEGEFHKNRGDARMALEGVMLRDMRMSEAQIKAVFLSMEEGTYEPGSFPANAGPKKGKTSGKP